MEYFLSQSLISDKNNYHLSHFLKEHLAAHKYEMSRKKYTQEELSMMQM